jgi:hypothetical protein
VSLDQPGTAAVARPTLLVVLTAAGACGVLLHEAAPALLRRVAAEDGALETAQALIYLFSALVCVWGLVRGSASRWAVPAMLGSVLLLGEELSWGQRLVGYAGPSLITMHNRQAEFNMHNLAPVNDGIRDVGVVLLLVAFVTVPLLLRRSPTCARLAHRLGIVAPGPLSTATALISIAYMRVPRWLGRNDYAFDEWGELFLAATVLNYAWQLAGVHRSRTA